MSQDGLTTQQITYRIQGLPSKCTAVKARRLVEAALNLNEESSPSFRLHSLAKSVIVKDEMTATISSCNLSTVLPNASQLSCWAFELPVGQAKGENERNSMDIITIDTSFDGFTPLNSVDDGGGHLFEYD
jgi:hypothetical protein